MDDSSTERKGFFGFIDTEYTAAFTLSLYTNRTFVMTTNSDREPWHYLPQNGKTIPTLCQNRTGRDCIFKPVSNCTMKQIENIIAYAKRTKSYTVMDHKSRAPVRKWAQRLDPDLFHKLTKDSMVIYRRFECGLFLNRKHAMNQKMIEALIERRNWNISHYEFVALIWSILMRMQDNIQSMVHEVVRDSLVKYQWKSKRNTIGMPIRGSDKCMPSSNVTSSSDRKFWHSPEMMCFGPHRFLEIAETVKERTDGEADTMIVTSEDESIIKMINNLTASNSMNVIYNDGDWMPGSGFLWDLETDIRSNEVEMFAIMVSMLSTIKLQMHARYYIIQRQSNWAHGIWVLSSCIHCQIDGIGSGGNVDEERYCINLKKQDDEEIIMWDPRLFDQKRNATTAVSECYREDRWDPWEK